MECKNMLVTSFPLLRVENSEVHSIAHIISKLFEMLILYIHIEWLNGITLYRYCCHFIPMSDTQVRAVHMILHSTNIHPRALHTQILSRKAVTSNCVHLCTICSHFLNEDRKFHGT